MKLAALLKVPGDIPEEDLEFLREHAKHDQDSADLVRRYERARAGLMLGRVADALSKDQLDPGERHVFATLFRQLADELDADRPTLN